MWVETVTNLPANLLFCKNLAHCGPIVPFFPREAANPEFYVLSLHFYMLTIFKIPVKATLNMSGLTEAANTHPLFGGYICMFNSYVLK